MGGESRGIKGKGGKVGGGNEEKVNLNKTRDLEKRIGRKGYIKMSLKYKVNEGYSKYTSITASIISKHGWLTIKSNSISKRENIEINSRNIRL